MSMVVYKYTINGTEETINRSGDASVVSSETLLFQAGYRPNWWNLYVDGRSNRKPLRSVDLNEHKTLIAHPKSASVEVDDYGDWNEGF